MKKARIWGLCSSVSAFFLMLVFTGCGGGGSTGNGGGGGGGNPPPPTSQVRATVDVLTDRHAISPYVYGTNFPNDANYIQDSGTTLVRWGGNASTRYNWTNFNTNAAADWYFSNRPMGNPPLYSDSTQFVSTVKTAGGFPLVTIGMLPWVAKDATSYSFSTSKYGYTPCHANPFSSDDGNGVLLVSNCDSTPSYVTGNDPHDAHVPLLDGPPQSGDPAGSVYRNQWVTALASAFGNGVPHFYDMDNESDIWSGTHRDVHPIGSGYNELRDTFLSESLAVKSWDPLATRFGPVSCCWYFYWNLPSPSDNKSSHANIDFLPWFLNEVYWADLVAAPSSLGFSLSVLDVHAYSEANPSGLTLAQQRSLALRATRDWWDPTYTSEAWFGTNSVTSNQPLDSVPFRIPRLRAMANVYYPFGNPPLSFTEWNFALAGESDFSTALADVDAFGILGRERVSYATRWTAADPSTPAYNSLKLYRNYDGNHSTFGTISVSATHDADPGLFGVFAATNSAGNSLTLMIVNKDPVNAAQTTFTLNGFTPSQVKAYTLSQTSPMSIVAGSSQAWSASMTFAPYSATLIVISGTTSQQPMVEWDLDPDTLMVPAGGTGFLLPQFSSVSSTTLTLGTPTSGAGISLSVVNANITPTASAFIKVTAGNTPGFYHFSVPASNNTTQSGWIVVGKPAATLTATSGDLQTGSVNTTLPQPLTVKLAPGQSGGSAGGASILLTTSGGVLSNGSVSGRRVLVTTDSAGTASVTLTLPGTAGSVGVKAEGPYGLGHPWILFHQTAQ